MTRYDVVVIGAGVAGLAFALHRPADLRVALLSKYPLGESNTRYAQGGLAAAVGVDDDPELHEADTLAAGAKLCDESAVRALVQGAPEAVAWLLGLGTAFDHDGEKLLLGREAAHSRRRVLHAGGDATGAEIERALVSGTRADPGVDVYENSVVRDLLVTDGRCDGVQIESTSNSCALTRFEAPVVVLAAGGMGQLWSTTSNPPGATADGLAMALRAGAAVADLEFVQFHPTVLRVPDTAPFLVSEAVRGEGAYLRSVGGERFMVNEHPLAELAPRDIVARAIQQQMERDGSDHVWLDLRHLDADAVRGRFPSIRAELEKRAIDLATDVIPVAPAAHYTMGGVVASPTGETSLPGLLAIGEVACTGVHGANRLASNSLLEGLVFGLAAAERLANDGLPARVESELAQPPPTEGWRGHQDDEVIVLRERLQMVMSRHVAVARDERGFAWALDEIRTIAAAAPCPSDRATTELANMVRVAEQVIEAALHRQESRGGHYRSDFPAKNHALDHCHSLLYGAGEGWRYGRLRDVLRGARDTSTS